jgi:hypothetical protein
VVRRVATRVKVVPPATGVKVAPPPWPVQGLREAAVELAVPEARSAAPKRLANLTGFSVT